MSTEKISELSKPVAWIIGEESIEEFKRGYETFVVRGDDVDSTEETMKLYSQEYVSALLADNERLARDLAARNGEIEGLRERVAELQAKLATPVRLKKVDSSNVPFAGDGFNAAVDYCAKAVRAAGFTVEGDGQ